MDKRDYYINNGIDNTGVSDIERFNTISQEGDSYRKQNPTFLMRESRVRPNSGSYIGATSNQRYDSRLPSVERMMNEDMTADQARAEEQSMFNRLGNSLVNNAVIAGTTAIGGSLGVLYGMVDAIANQELNRLYDNPVNRKMLEWQEATAEAAPNYYSKGYEESSIWNKMGTSIFWADLIKNLGFTEGMMIPGMGVSSLMQAAPLPLQLIVSSAAGAISEASIEALQAKKDKMYQEDTQLVDTFNQAIRNAKTQEEKDFIQQEYDNIVSGIEDDANSVGNYVLGYNMALLTITNSLEWGKLFTRGNKASRAALMSKERGKGIKVAKDGLSIDIEKPWVNTAKELGSRALNATEEGLEEVFQDIAVKSADLNPNYNSFNESIFNPEKRELADSGLQALGMAFSQAMKDPETATNFAMGFFTSVIGSPILRSPKGEDGGFRSPVAMEGGISEFISNRQEYKRRKSIVDNINNRMSDPSFTEYYNGIVRSMDLTEKANQALEAGDTFNFNNYQFASMISDIIMLDNVGHPEVLDNIIEKISNISDEEVQGLIDQELFTQNGNPMSIGDAKQKLQENAETMKSLSAQYREMKEAFEATKKGPEFSKEALENLIYAKLQLENWKKRQAQITDEIVGLYKSLTPMMNEKDVMSDNAVKLVATIPDTRAGLKKIVSESDLTNDVKEEWIKKIDDLDKIQKNIGEFTKQINDYYDSPKKANKNQEDIKKQAIKKDTERRSSGAKEQLANAKSPKDLRRIYRNLQSEGTVSQVQLDKLINELDEEDNAVVKENKNIQSIYQGVVAKLQELGLDQNTISNAIHMLRNAMENASNSNELAEPTNPYYTNASLFFGEDIPSTEDRNQDLNRFLAAQVAAYTALSKQLSEMGKNAESAKFTAAVNPANPPANPTPQSTGDSGVTPVPSVNPNVGVADPGFIISEDGLPGAKPAGTDNTGKDGIHEQPNTKDAQVEEVKHESSTDPNRSWFPLSWFFLGAKRKDGSLVPISDKEAIQKIDPNVDFGQIPQWIEQNGVQEYIDSGNLKEGDKLVLGIPSDLTDINGNPVIVYYKTDGDRRIPVGIFAASGALAKSARDKILSEYNGIEDKTKTFYSSMTTTVTDVKTGYIQYGESRPISGEVQLAVVRNGTVTTNGSVKPSEVNRPSRISEKNGMVYALIPNSRKGSTRGYTSIGIKVKRFNKSEYPLDIESHKNSPIVKNILGAINGIIGSKTQQGLVNAVQLLSNYLYIPNLNFYLTKDGKIRVTSTVLDNKGNPIKKTVKKEDGTSESVNKENVVGIYDNTDNLFNLLYSIGPRFQVKSTLINTAGYNKSLTDSDVLYTNASSKSTGGWFTANPIGENGKIQGSKITYPKSTPSTTTDKGANVAVNGRQMILFSDGSFLSPVTGTKTLPKNADTQERYKVLYNLQSQYGDATQGPTMWNNKAVVGDRVIDRVTGEWVTGVAAKEVMDHVNPKKNIKTEVQSKPRDVNTSIVITRTCAGYDIVHGKGTTPFWAKTKDIRTLPDGWGTVNNLYYFKRTFEGARGDNFTIWFDSELSESDKKLVLKILEEKNDFDDIIEEFKNLEYIKGTKPVQGMSDGALLFENHDDTDPVDDVKDNTTFPNGKIGYYLDSKDGRIHKASMVPIDPILGTPVYLVKIPVYTKGLNRNGPSQLVGYNYGIVFPNGRSFISSSIATDNTPISTVISAIKAKFEGAPGMSQGLIEENKKVFKNLESKPPVFSPKVDSVAESQTVEPQTPEVQQESATVQSEDSEDMSFNDFMGIMGAEMADNSPISGFSRAKLRESTTKEYSKADLEKEIKWLGKILPNIPVEVREGILHIAEKDAWGMFSKAGITLSNVAASGTAYHEAFHVVFSLGLEQSEREALLNEAAKESGISDVGELEEWLSERFREYVMDQNTKSIGQRIKEWFKKIWNGIWGIKEAEPFRYSIYKKITAGKFRNVRLEYDTSIDISSKSDTGNINTNNLDTKSRETNYDSEFLEHGYTEEWIKNATPDEKRVAKTCLGV